MQILTKINPHLTGIKAPSILASKPMWLMWRFEHIDGGDKPRKVPYYINGQKRHGVQGRLEDRQNLATFEAAKAAAIKRGFDGIGHACLDGDFTVIDFDKCAVNGELNRSIESLATNTYAEYSPSGEGIHLYVQGNLHNSNSKSNASRDSFGIELFATKGFVTFTGNALEIVCLLGTNDVVAPPSQELKRLVNLRFGEPGVELSENAQTPLGLAREAIFEALDVLDPDMAYEDWLKIGMALHHETGGEGFDIWDQWSAKGSKYPGDGMLRGRWDSFGKSPGKEVTIRSLVKMANANGARISVNSVNLEEFDNLDIENASHSDQDKTSRFKRIPAHEFAVVTHWNYLIKHIIPAASIGVLFGESGSGKSFITLDMCIAIARGTSWRGNRTTQGRVVYVVAEGAEGFRNRLAAYAKHHGVDLASIPLDIINDAPNLLALEETKGLIGSIKSAPTKPTLVVLDTLAQTMAGGNENASEDMGKVLAHCKGINRSTGAMVLLIHHAGKDSSRGARGWSGLRAAADVELEVSRSLAGRVLRSTKQKDGADFKEWGFDLEIVPIGEDQDGEVVSSCVCVEAEIPEKVAPNGKESGRANIQAVLSTVGSIALTQVDGIPYDTFIDEIMEQFQNLEGKTLEIKRKNIKALVKKLSGDDSGFVLNEDGTIKIV